MAGRIADSVRFSADAQGQSVGNGEGVVGALSGRLLQTELRITPEITPTLSAQMDSVAKRLQVPGQGIQAFVYPSSEAQAECYSDDSSECVIRFSSSLVDLLAEDEFGFVAGHELGHFLLGHTAYRLGQTGRSVEDLILMRAQEISADRVGLLAAESLDSAIRAMIKMASGLSNQHLRFDVGKFISQLDSVSDAHLASGVSGSTHPSIIVRCRALLWFAMEDYKPLSSTPDSLIRLDNRVQTDLDRYINGPARRRIEDARLDLSLWLSSLEIAKDGVFGSHEQDTIEEMFGVAILLKLKDFLDGIPTTEAISEIEKRVFTATENLRSLIPATFDNELDEIRRSTARSLGNRHL
jgi:hypothetical protein